MMARLQHTYTIKVHTYNNEQTFAGMDNETPFLVDDQPKPSLEDNSGRICGRYRKHLSGQAAKLYFEDAIIEDACPPVKAVLLAMAYGHYNGKSIGDL
jgi:hypothetical protein